MSVKVSTPLDRAETAHVDNKDLGRGKAAPPQRMLLHAAEKPDQEIRHDGADRIPRNVAAEIARPGILLGTHAAASA